ncbi:MAG TPA: hypothetical protein VNZ45_05660, partial [Bacteroidia bacterium]|nr:hypothetical protein [Bacteroidia bacterium]
MKKLILALLFILNLISINLLAQTTTVTATVLFPDGQPFVNGNVTAAFTPSSGNISVFTYKLNGAAFPYNVSGTMNGSGTFSIILTDDHRVTPLGGQWTITVCSNANLPCSSSIQDVFGPSIDLSGPINAAILVASGNSFGYPKFYNDTEAALNLGPGIAYYNLNTNKIRFFNGTIWQDVSTGGGGGGNINPGSNPSQFAVWSVGSSLWNPQNKAIYDVRDWATCDGVADATTTGPNGGVKALLNAIGTQEATIQWVGSTTPSSHCRLENTLFPANVSHDFSGGGALEMISSTTPVGNAVFVNGTSAECEFPPTHTSCSTANAAHGSTTLSITAGNTIVVAVSPYPGFTYKILSVTDNCGDIFYHLQQSLVGQPRNTGAWVASNAIGGTCTITANASATAALTHTQVLVDQFSGMGPVVSLDGKGSSNNADATTMDSLAATTTAGSLLIGYGGQPFTPETCTAGTGFTQPAGLAGQSTNGLICAEYKLSSPGGSQNATQVITSSPTGSWVYNILPLKVGNATAIILGGINDPDLHQIFFNANGTATQGAVDFTNSNVLPVVYPEWWGANTTASPTINTPALQAAVWASFGNGPTPARTNGSGFNVYNRPLYLQGNYQINSELQFYSVTSFKVICANRLTAGITQTAANLRIIDGQSVSYGAFYDCSWTGGTSTSPLIDLDYDNIETKGDIKPQFIDFYNNTFIGNSATAVGVQIAKSGGAAQGSNIYCYDCEANGFTTAAWQIGLPNNLAQNALAIGWYGGDIQNCPQYGIANYGGGFITIFGTTFEDNFSTQTGFDILSSQSQGPLIMEGVRSESRKFVAASNLDIRDSGNTNQATTITPGASDPVGTIKTGNYVTGDGAYYQVTTDAGGYVGAGNPAAPIIASSGTATSVTDTNQIVSGSVTIKTFTAAEGITQAVTGSTANLVVTPVSTGTITGSVTSGTIGSGHTMTQSTTGVTCTSTNAPTGSQSLTCN